MSFHNKEQQTSNLVHHHFDNCESNLEYKEVHHF